jgi:hypothetical protein
MDQNRRSLASRLEVVAGAGEDPPGFGLSLLSVGEARVSVGRDHSPHRAHQIEHLLLEVWD